MRVLIVDDEKNIRTALAGTLNKRGFTVTEVSAPTQAFDRFLSQDFEFLIVDMNMPVMSGAEFLAKLRHCGIRRPTVILTSDVSSDRMPGGGEVIVISKDLGLNEIVRKIEDFIKTCNSSK